MTSEQDPQAATDPALPAKRRAEMLKIARLTGQITVNDMSQKFEVSLDTIRRDLDLLAEQGLLSRIHGGAVPFGHLATADAPLDQRLAARHDAKTRIGKAAAKLIANGETLIVNGGSTTLAFVAALGGHSGLTIVTNNLSLPAEAPAKAVRGLYLLGGEIRGGARITLGAVGFAGSGGISADTAVIGVGGIAPEGCSTSDLAEASMMADMINASRRTIIVADSDKFGRHAFARVSPLDRVDCLVTDIRPPAILMDALEAAGVTVVIAGRD